MNDPLVEMLSCVTDARRAQAKRYDLANILLFCIFGFLCGAKSYKAHPFQGDALDCARTRAVAM